MLVPTYDKFIEPLLRFLALQPGGVPVRQVYAALAQQMALTAEQQAILLPSGGQRTFQNRIGWASDRLRRAGYAEVPRRGLWAMTPAGRRFASQYAELTEQQIRSLAKVETGAGAAGVAVDRPDDGAALDAATLSPEDRVEIGLAEVRASVADDILAAVSRNTPAFFERAVLDLLFAMGYGRNRQDLQNVGGSGDGGIDGIISLDRLGLEKIYVQAKRWKGQVGSPEIQGFLGALQLRDAQKGVFITSGAFSEPARRAVERARGTVVLIDGDSLARLMIDHKVGVTCEEKLLPRLDGDYFDRD